MEYLVSRVGCQSTRSIFFFPQILTSPPSAAPRDDNSLIPDYLIPNCLIPNTWYLNSYSPSPIRHSLTTKQHLKTQMLSKTEYHSGYNRPLSSSSPALGGVEVR